MLRFLTSLLGPIFAKEMVEMARRKRYYLNRVLYGVALLFATFIIWIDYQERLRSWMTNSLALMAQLANDLFIAVSSVQYGAVFLFVPTYVCGVIAGEREGRTLELLFTTQLKDHEIVLGKLASRIAMIVLLILSALPVMSLLMLFGGIEPGILWRTQATTLLAILYTGAHAIYFSAITRSTLGALVRTYCWFVIWMLGLPSMLALLLILLEIRISEEWFMGAMVLVNPLIPFVFTISGDWSFILPPSVVQWLFPLSFIAPLGWSLFLLWRAVVRLRKISLVPTAVTRVRAKRALGTRHAARQSRRGAILSIFPVHNPLWLRARLAPVYDRERHFRLIQWAGWVILAGSLLLVGMVEPDDLEDSEFAAIFLGFTWAVVATLTAILAAASLVGDRQHGLLELVLTTPLPPREVIDGTAFAVIEHLKPAYVSVLALYVFFLLTGAIVPVGIACSLITALLFCAVLIAIGTICSLAAKNAAEALMPTITFGMLMCVGLPCTTVFEKASGPIIWVTTGVLLPVTWVWSRRRTSAAAVGGYFIAVHLTLTALATFWTAHGTNPYGVFPALAMNPGYWTIAPLLYIDEYFFFNKEPFWYWGLGRWYWALLCYWSALVVNLLWARWWMMRNFDRLTGRTLKQPDRTSAPTRNNPTITPESPAVAPS